MEQAYAEWREIEEDQEVELIRRTGLLCFPEEAENEHTSDVIKAFEATPGARFSTFYGKVYYGDLETQKNGRYKGFSRQVSVSETRSGWSRVLRS